MTDFGLFESLAADDSDSRVATRKAVAVANARVRNQLGAFIAAAETSSERTARLSLVRSDLSNIVSSVCEEYGGDPTKIEASILHELTRPYPLTNDEEEGDIQAAYYGEPREAGVEHTAPGKEHLPAATPKRNRQYEHILASCKESHPDYSEDRCKELAASTVNKTRAEKGETKGSRVAQRPQRSLITGEPLPETRPGQPDEERSLITGQPLPQPDAPGGTDPGADVGPLPPAPAEPTPDPEGSDFSHDHGEFADYLDMVAGDYRESGSEATAEDYQEAARRIRELSGGGDADLGPPNFPEPKGRGPEPQSWGLASVQHTARRPKMCPYHREVTDISLASGDPVAGFNAMSQHAWGPQHCQGEFEGGCNFKREMVTQKYWDDKAEQAAERAKQREQLREQEQFQVPDSPEGIDETPSAEHGINEDLADAPSAVGEGGEDVGMEMGQLEPMSASTEANSIPPEPNAPVGPAAAPPPPVVTPPQPAPMNPPAGVTAPPGGSAVLPTIQSVPGGQQPGNPLLDQLRNQVQQNQQPPMPMSAATREAQQPIPARPGTQPVMPLPPEPPPAPTVTRPTQAPGRPGTIRPGAPAPLVNAPPLEQAGQQAQQQFTDQIKLTPGGPVTRPDATNAVRQQIPSPAQQSAQGIRQQMQQRPNFDPGQYNVEHFQQQQLKNPRGPGVRASEERTAEAPRDGGGAVETVDVEGKEGPVPKMDKERWKPNALNPSGNLEAVDSETSGSPVPEKEIDILEAIPADRDADFLDGTDAVTEEQDVTQGDEHSTIEDSGPTKTWSENNNAAPVTSASEDAYKNPMLAILEEEFLSPQQVEAAIKEYESD